MCLEEDLLFADDYLKVARYVSGPESIRNLKEFHIVELIK